MTEDDVGHLFGDEGNELEIVRFEFGGKTQRIKALAESTRFTVQGHVLWQGARWLSSFLCEEPAKWSSYGRAIELGSGCGLAGIVLSQVSGIEVTLSDFDEEVVSLLRENAKANQGVRISVEKLDWRAPVEERLAGRFPLVIAEDVTHNKELYGPLFTCASRLMATGGLFVMANGRWRYFDKDVALAVSEAGLELVSEKLVDDDSIILTHIRKPS